MTPAKPLNDHPKRASTEQDLRAAVVFHRSGDLDRAAALYQRVLDRTPGNADALHMLGLVAGARGQSERAIDLIVKALQQSPDFAAAHLNLAVALRDAGRLDAAAESCRRAIALQSNVAVAHSTLGRILTELGQYAAAIASCRTAVSLDPNLAEAHVNLGSALFRHRQFNDAAVSYRCALALNPERAETHRDLGITLAALEEHDNALGCYQRALTLNPDDAACHCARASALMQRHRAPAAEQGFLRATELEPDRVEAWVGLGRVLRTLGRFDEADRCTRRVQALDPGHVETYHHLITTGRRGDEAGEIERLTTVLEAPDSSSHARIVAGFALGRLLDDADCHDEAFARYVSANALCREAMNARDIRFDGNLFRQEIDLLIEYYTPKRFAAAQGGARSELPVFIVGMPRSGTTLVEQIASSHSQVFGAGELEEIGRIAATLASERERRGTTQHVDPMLAGRLAQMHVEYLQRLSGGARRVTDKLPGNVLHLGLTAQLFPQARVILCRRDARDISLSCYFQLFVEGLHPFAYDLADCGSCTLGMQRLGDHWRQTLPLRFHEVCYESLVADLEGESQRLIDFLGLDWEPACLEFHRTERTVTTLSQWQVRQPLYTRSVGRWRQYARHLGPLFAVLEQGGASVDGAPGVRT